VPLTPQQPDDALDTSELAVGGAVTPQLPAMQADDDGTGASSPKYSPLDVWDAANRQGFVGRLGANADLRQAAGYNFMNPGPKIDPETAIPDEMLPWKDKYVGLDTASEIRYRTAQLKQSFEDARVMQSSKWGGLAAMALGLSDPVATASLAIPIAGETRLANAVRMAAVGAGVSATDEALMHTMDPMATFEGSAVNIGAGTILSGLMGAAIRGHVPAEDFERLRSRLQQDFQAPVAQAPVIPEGDNAADIARDIRTAVDAHQAAQTSGPNGEPPVPEGHVRMYHGGTEYEGGPRWMAQDRPYAEGYAAKSGEAGRTYYLDLPEDSPQLKKAFDDEGTGTKSPYVAFEAPEELARGLKELPSRENGNATPARELPETESGTKATGSDIESRFRDYLAANPDEARARYEAHPDTEGGRVLNTDTARELSADYLSDRTKSADVHEPASKFIKERYAEALQQAPKPGQDNTVLFTAGGTGAGKSTGMKALGDAAGHAQIVYDTNMNSLASARTKIEQALAAGKDVRIVYTYRDPVEALEKGALSRAMRQEGTFGSGRTVPIEEHLKTHIGALDTMRALAEEYHGDSRVDIRAIDNTRGVGQAAAVPLESIGDLDYNTLHEQAHNALESARLAGPGRGGISESVYRGFKGAPAEEPEPRLGAGGRGQPEQEREGGLSAAVAQKVAKAPSVALKRAIGDPVLQDQLQHMADTESGWWQEGGRVLRDDKDQVTGRTGWIPNAEWWPGRPGGYSPKQVQSIIAKAIAGEHLGGTQQRLVEYMTEVADARVANEPYLPHGEVFEGLDEHLHAGNVQDEHETAMVTRLALIDEAAVENLARHFEEDHNGFLREVKRTLDAHDTDAGLARSGLPERDTPGPIDRTAAERPVGSASGAGEPHTRNPLVEFERDAGDTRSAEPAAAARGPVAPPPYASLREELAKLPEMDRAKFEARLAALESPPIISAGGDSTAGAMQVGADITLKDLSLARGGRVLGKALGWFAPGSRTLNSPSLEVRKAVISMMETPEMLEMNVPTPERPNGIQTPPAVETLLKRWEGSWAQGFSARDALYREYRAREVARVDPLDRRQFNEEVSHAMRRGDIHGIPEVQKAARETRRLVFDPLKAEAQKMGLLPKQDQLSLGGTAESYLMRQYNRAAIQADRAAWHTLLRDGFRAQDVDTADADTIAHQVTRNLLGSEMGLLDMNDVVFKDVVPQSGRLQARTLLLPDQVLEKYLVNDIDSLSHSYLKSLAPQVEVTRRFGDRSMQETFKNVTDEYEVLMQRELATGNSDGANKLSDRLRADLRDLAAMRDRMYGIFGVPSDPRGWWQRAGRVIRSVNAFRLLGTATWSHIPDAANVIMRHGLPGTMAAAAKLSTSLEALKLNRTELQRLGTALDMVHNSTAAQLGEFGVESNYKFQKFLNRGTRAFTIATLETPWIASIKAVAGAVAHDQILETAERAAGGSRLGSNERIRMNQSGLSQAMLERIAAQYQKYGKQVNGLRFGMSDKWDDQVAQRTLEAAVNRAAEASTLSPSKGDTPLWTSSEVGKSIFQFKTFGAVAVRKVLIPLAQGLAHADLRSAQGLATLVAAGAATYTMKQLLSGQPLEKDPTRYALEVLDKSNLLGWTGEYFYPMLWQAGMQNFSRWGDRQTWETLGGPVAGAAVDAWDLRIPAKVRGQMSSSYDPKQAHFSRGDIHRIRRMLPGNQIWYLRQAVNTLEGKVGDAMGLAPAAPPRGSTE
jgi:hypothetical protein